MPKTELLKLDVSESDRWIVPIDSGFYHEALCIWFNYVGGLRGNGLAIGDSSSVSEHIKIKYPESITTCVDFNCPEGISWDICNTPDNLLVNKYDWIICQAVLEHVIDPVASIRNMLSCLKKDGNLFIHTVLPGFQLHDYPVDCFRFLPDFFVGLPKIINADLFDLYNNYPHICSFFRKRFND